MKLAALALAAAVGALVLLLLLANSLEGGYEVNYTLYAQTATPYGAKSSALAWMVVGWSGTSGYMVLKPAAQQGAEAALYAAVEDGKTYTAMCSGKTCVGYVKESPLRLVEAKIEKKGVCQHLGKSGEMYVANLSTGISIVGQVEAEACVSGDLLLWARETYKIDVKGETYTVTIWINATELRKFNTQKYKEVLSFVKSLHTR